MALRKILVFETEPYETIWMVDEEGTIYRHTLTNVYPNVKFVGVKHPAEAKIYTFDELIKNPSLALGKYFVVYDEKEGKQKELYWIPGSDDTQVLVDFVPHKIAKAYISKKGVVEADIEWDEVEEEIDIEKVVDEEIEEEKIEKKVEDIKGLKKAYVEIRDKGEVYVWKVLTQEEINKKIKEAVERYKKRTGKKEKLYKSELKLPRIITADNQEIDLNEYFKDATAIVELIGLVPYICYIDEKDGYKIKYIHFPETDVYLVADSSDPTRIYLVHGLRLTNEGLKG